MKVNSVMKPAIPVINNTLTFPGSGWRRGQGLVQSVITLDRPVEALNTSKDSFQGTCHSYSFAEANHDPPRFGSARTPTRPHSRPADWANGCVWLGVPKGYRPLHVPGARAAWVTGFGSPGTVGLS